MSEQTENSAHSFTEGADQPYFKVSRNDYGKPFFFYSPCGDNRYNCWMPVDEKFEIEFQKIMDTSAELSTLRATNEELSSAVDRLETILSKVAAAATLEEYNKMVTMINNLKTLDSVTSHKPSNWIQKIANENVDLRAANDRLTIENNALMKQVEYWRLEYEQHRQSKFKP